jgi:hypothetical protein
MVYAGTSHVFQPEHRIVAAEGKISGRNWAEGTDQPDPSMRTKIDVFLARLLTGMPILGRLGEPYNVAQQLTILHDAFQFLYIARPGELRDLPYRWKRESYSVPADWAR